MFEEADRIARVSNGLEQAWKWRKHSTGIVLGGWVIGGVVGVVTGNYELGGIVTGASSIVTVPMAAEAHVDVKDYRRDLIDLIEQIDPQPK